MNRPRCRDDVGRDLVHGLNESVMGNAQAFGFSITVTVTFGLLSTAEGRPRVLELFGFALCSVAAFSLLNLVVFTLVRQRPEADAPQRALLVGTATDFLAVGAAVGAAYAMTLVATGALAWTMAPFLAGIVYVLVQSVELAIGRGETGDR